MIRYIPDELFVDLKNKEKVKKILNDIPDTSLRIPGIKTIEDGIRKLKNWVKPRLQISLATGEESTVKWPCFSYALTSYQGIAENVYMAVI